MEQPKPTSPSSRLPELNKFIKPHFFQALGHEYFKDKNNIDKSSLKILNPYKTNIPQKSTRTSKGIYREPLLDNQVYRLDYKIKNENLWINLVPLYENSEFYLHESYPDSFPVLQRIKYKDIKTLDCLINEKIRKVDPAEISIYFEENNSLYLNFLNEIFYKIDIQSDSTKAVLVQ